MRKAIIMNMIFSDWFDALGNTSMVHSRERYDDQADPRCSAADKQRFVSRSCAEESQEQGLQGGDQRGQ